MSAPPPTLRLHNTLGNQVEDFVPAGSPVTMYVCGPTVYGEPHVGNARPLVVFDVLFRLLRLFYREVSYARNITDIDDKIIAAAVHEGVRPDVIAGRYANSYSSGAKKLNCLVPTLEPRATQYIGEMIDFIDQLMVTGHAYAAEGHVLFNVGQFADYGKLANRTRDEMIAGARVEVAPYKRDPGDFVLWKPAAEHEPGWDSPWGRGRPGWHLECSAMIRSCLGETIDIHGGGIDLAFPHHENEIAQSRCAHGAPTLARYWVHNGHVTLDGAKMAKSAGNIDQLADALAAHPGEVVRYALLSGHYRKPLDWSAALLASAAAALDRLYRTLAAGPVATADAPPQFVTALADDLNTPQAHAVLHELASTANRAAGEEAARARGELRAAGQLIGLLEQDPTTWLKGDGDLDADAAIDDLVHARSEARAAGDYARADALRAELTSMGVEVEDRAGTTTWRRR